MFVDIEFVSRKVAHKADADSFIDIILALGHRYILRFADSKLT